MACNINKKISKIGVSQNIIKKLVKFILDKHKKKDADVSINFVGDQRMSSLNYLYRGKKKTTDVLAFSAMEGKNIGKKNDLGDVFISVSQVRRQAGEFEVPYREELLRMVIHGLLHLLGYDHTGKTKAKEMFSIQEKLINNFL